jgi:hypothetical protein
VYLPALTGVGSANAAVQVTLPCPPDAVNWWDTVLPGTVGSSGSTLIANVAPITSVRTAQKRAAEGFAASLTQGEIGNPPDLTVASPARQERKAGREARIAAAICASPAPCDAA